MPTNSKKTDASVLSRLATRGEDAVTRLMEEMGRNPRVTEALGAAMSAKGKVDTKTRETLRQIGLAAADEIKDLRGNLERLEKRLAKLEGGNTKPAARKPAAKKPAPKKPAARKPAAKKPAAKKPAPKKPPV
jgi:polyhydroxyalkanoate synthesis regulator phasin